MIPSQRHLFELPEEIAYFNCAYTSPLLKTAADAGKKALKQKHEPWTITSDLFFKTCEDNRQLFAQLIDCDPDQVAIVPSVSYGIALAAKNLPIEKRQHIVVLQDQFPSNIYPWRRLAAEHAAEIKIVPRPNNDDWTPVVIDAIGEDTAIAALPNCHWTDGTLLDLEAIGLKCRHTGTALALDAIQSLRALPFSVKTIKPDFLTAASHKWLLGPYSYGFCYISSKWNNGIPVEENWLNREGSEDFSRLVDYRDTYQAGARRFDVGESSNFFLAPIANEALKQILAWGVNNISATLGNTTHQIAEQAKEIGFEVTARNNRAPHLIGLYLPDGLPGDLSTILSREKVFVSVRGNAIRVAPHLYNTSEDIDRLFIALKKALK